MDEYIDRVTCKVCGERLDKMDITTAQVHLSQHIADILYGKGPVGTEHPEERRETLHD